MTGSAETSDRISETVTVDLGERSYDIAIGEGLLEQTPNLLGTLLKRPRIAIVTDETVGKLYGDTLQSAFSEQGIETSLLTVAPGEGSKSFATLETVLSALIEDGIERGDLIIALGGGIVGDLTGFAAAILRRGCRYVQIPTTLLAQVDSSVGGKTAINVSQGKNLVGAFHQPAKVIIDPLVLKTLSERQKRAGYAEIVKYGLIDDKVFLDWLEENGSQVLAGDTRAVTHAIAHSCRAKARIVSADETESGARALLNLGHTFGHALEAATGFGEHLYHGEGVALGCAMAFRFSASEGLCSREDADRVEAHLKSIGLPTQIADIEGPSPKAETVFSHMLQDKKVEAGTLTLILAKGVGKSFIARDVDPVKVRAFLETETRG